MVDVFDFHVKQISAWYPQVSGATCRLSQVRVLTFPGESVNDLVLYRVDTQASANDPWMPVKTHRATDDDWFGFERKPTEIEPQALLRACHRHFVERALVGKVKYSIPDFLSTYKRSTVYPVRMQMQDQRLVEYWDTMLVRRLDLRSDDTYSDHYVGTVKLREVWVINHPEPIDPYRPGVLYTFPVNRPTLDTVKAVVQTTARHPAVWGKGEPLSGAILPIYHALKPEIAQ